MEEKQYNNDLLESSELRQGTTSSRYPGKIKKNKRRIMVPLDKGYVTRIVDENSQRYDKLSYEQLIKIVLDDTKIIPNS